MAFLQIVIATCILLIVAWFLFVLIFVICEVKLPRFNWFRYKRIELQNFKSQIKSRNELYKCKHQDCKRMYRKYQYELSTSLKETERCPHCTKESYEFKGWNTSRYFLKVVSEDKWMASHVDCPKINIRGYTKIRKLIKNAERLKKEEAVQQRFEEYNELEPNMDWIRNLQKK